MKNLSRRDFLKVSGAGAGVWGLMMLTGCGSSSETESSSSGTAESSTTETSTENTTESTGETAGTEESSVDVIRLATDDPKDLSPLVTNGNGKSVLFEFFQAFASYDGFGGELYGVLAKDWYWEDDTHFVVEMYDYIYDSEGHHITAEDALYSIQASCDIGQSTNSSFVESYEIRDEYTLVCYCPNGAALGATDTFLTEYVIFSQEAYEASSDGMSTSPVGTGHYVVESFVSGSSLVLTRNEDYWQTDESLIGPQQQANVERIEYSVTSETSSLIAALQTQTIDAATSVPQAYMDQFYDGGAYGDIYDYSTIGLDLIYFLAPNVSSDSLMANEDLRAAIFYAIDVDAICTAFGEDAAVKVNAFCSPIYADYCEQWDVDAQSNYYGIYDLDLAKEYLEKSGYAGEELVIAGENTTQISTIMQIVGGYLDALGVKYTITPYDSTTYSDVQKTSTAWDLWVQPYGSTTYIVTCWNRALNNTRRTSGTTLNFLYDEDLQAALEAALGADTHSEETVYAVQEMLTDNYWWYGLLYLNQFSVYNSSKIETVCFDWRNNIVPGGCTYK